MKLIDRYVARQILVTGIFAVAVLSLVLVLLNVFKRLLEYLVARDVPLDFILSFVAYIVPFSLTFTIPWGFLTAVLLIYGRMSAENELIALKSSGVSITRISAGVFAIAAACVGVCLWINIEVAPRAETKMKEALYQIATNDPLAMFGSDKIIEEFPGKKIYVERNTGAELQNIFVYELNDDDTPKNVVFARRGQITIDRPEQQLLLRLFDARIEQYDAKTPGDFSKVQLALAEETTFPISLRELYEENQKKKSFSGMTAGELLARLEEENLEGRSKEKMESLRSTARTEFNKRFSIALASLAFVLVGIPLGITAHRRETSIGFLLSLAVALCYFLFIILADTLRHKPGAHPELLVWLPNVLFIGLGLVLFYRLSRH